MMLIDAVARVNVNGGICSLLLLLLLLFVVVVVVGWLVVDE